MNYKKLAAYSAAASALLSIHRESNAQMVYENIDPDFIDTDYFTFPLDMDGDGINELVFNGSTSWFMTTGYSFYEVYIDQWMFLDLVCDIATNAGDVMHMELGETVGALTPFAPSASFVSADFAYGAAGSWVDINNGIEWVNDEGYFGVRFNIGANVHYGWIRVEVEQTYPLARPTLVVKDYAYNATPDEAAPITAYFAGTASSLTLSDVGDLMTPADLQLTFSKAEDETTVNSYRVVLTPELDMLTVADLEAVPSERYLEIVPTGGDHTITFTESTLDYNGDILLPDVMYRAIILSIADGVIAQVNDISHFSNSNNFDFDLAPVASGILLETNMVNHDITGFIGSFEMTDVSVSSVRAYITDNSYTLDELLALGSEYYVEIIPAIGTNAVNFTADKLIYPTLTPVLFELYYLNIVSMPDMVTNSVAAMESNWDHFSYNYYDEAPDVSIVGATGTGADIQLNFPKFNNEDDMSSYWIFVAKSDVVIDLESFPSFDADRYIEIDPTDTDLDQNLSGLLKDTDGSTLQPDQPYKAYILLRGNFADEPYALSAPSDEFTLVADPDEVDTEIALNAVEIWNNDNIIYVNGLQEGAHVLNIYNATGQMVFFRELAGGSHDLTVQDINPGVYIITVSGNGLFVRKSIIIEP